MKIMKNRSGSFALLASLSAGVSCIALCAGRADARPSLQTPPTDAALPASVVAAPADSLSLSLRAMETAERGSVDLDVTQATVEELLNKLQSASKIPLRIDWPSLERMGIARDDRIDFHIKDVPPLIALKAIAGALDADVDRPVVDASAGQIVLTSPRGLAAFREVAFYEVADILVDPTLIDALALQQRAAEEATEADGGADAPAVAVEPSMQARSERLIEIISEHIDPEGWLDTGGSRGRITSEAGRLIVTATPLTHRQLRTMLATLREQAPTSATVSYLILSVPTTTLDELTARAAGNRQALVSSLPGAPGAVVVASPRVATQLGEEATIDIKDASRMILCRAKPTFDRLRQTLTIKAAVTMEFAGDGGPIRGSLESTLVGSGREVNDVIRLASGPSPSETWIVVVRGVTDPRGSPSS